MSHKFDIEYVIPFLDREVMYDRYSQEELNRRIKDKMASDLARKLVENIDLKCEEDESTGDLAWRAHFCIE